MRADRFAAVEMLVVRNPDRVITLGDGVAAPAGVPEVASSQRSKPGCSTSVTGHSRPTQRDLGAGSCPLRSKSDRNAAAT
jgi:hypothetical protein